MLYNHVNVLKYNLCHTFFPLEMLEQAGSPFLKLQLLVECQAKPASVAVEGLKGEKPWLVLYCLERKFVLPRKKVICMPVFETQKPIFGAVWLLFFLPLDHSQ